MIIARQHPGFFLTISAIASRWQWVLHSISSQYHKTREQIQEEFKLIELCKKDPRRFSPVYERYYDEIFLFIYKRIDNEEITADITSRVFLNALKNLNKYTFQGVPFSAWLYRIALNEINQFYRTQKKMNRVVSIEDSHINLLFTEMDVEEPEKEPEKKVEILLSNLGEEEVQLLELRFFEERSFKEMGYLLGLTEVNAKIKTYRTLKKLKKVAESLNWD